MLFKRRPMGGYDDEIAGGRHMPVIDPTTKDTNQMVEFFGMIFKAAHTWLLQQ
jgi:hypothetical protein